MKKYIIPLAVVLLLLISLMNSYTIVRMGDVAESKVNYKQSTIDPSIESKTEPSIETDIVTPTPEQTAKEQPIKTDPVSPASKQITKEQAIEIALKHSDFTEDQVRHLRAEYEIDDRVPQYDVQYYVDRWEYEYEIHAETGDILSFDKDD